MRSRKTVRFVAPLLIASVAGVAAPITLTMSSGVGIPGGSVDLPLTLEGTSNPSAVEWTISYPTADLVSLSLTVGEAATDAGKSLQCGPDTLGSLTCLVFGFNQTIIQPGVLALVSASLVQSPVDQTIPLTLSATNASDPSANSIDVSGVGGAITVQAVPEPKSLWFAGLTLVIAGASKRLREVKRYNWR